MSTIKQQVKRWQHGEETKKAGVIDIMLERTNEGLLRYSVSLVTQGRHKFYTLTVPSDVLARTCFATSRDEDPKMGFQRVLDKERAQEIADYIDSGFGTIPNSMILSAQPEAMLEVIGRGKTLQFRDTQRAFLIGPTEGNVR